MTWGEFKAKGDEKILDKSETDKCINISQAEKL